MAVDPVVSVEQLRAALAPLSLSMEQSLLKARNYYSHDHHEVVRLAYDIEFGGMGHQGRSIIKALQRRGFMDNNYQITDLGRWRLAIELREIPSDTLPPPTAVFPMDKPKFDDGGETIYTPPATPGVVAGGKLGSVASGIQLEALYASWRHGDPAKCLPFDKKLQSNWKSTVEALDRKGWVEKETGRITDVGRWMLAVSLKKISRQSLPPVDVDCYGRPKTGRE